MFRSRQSFFASDCHYCDAREKSGLISFIRFSPKEQESVNVSRVTTNYAMPFNDSSTVGELESVSFCCGCRNRCQCSTVGRDLFECFIWMDFFAFSSNNGISEGF